MFYQSDPLKRLLFCVGGQFATINLQFTCLTCLVVDWVYKNIHSKTDVAMLAIRCIIILVHFALKSALFDYFCCLLFCRAFMQSLCASIYNLECSGNKQMNKSYIQISQAHRHGRTFLNCHRGLSLMTENNRHVFSI